MQHFPQPYQNHAGSKKPARRARRLPAAQVLLSEEAWQDVQALLQAFPSSAYAINLGLHVISEDLPRPRCAHGWRSGREARGAGNDLGRERNAHVVAPHEAPAARTSPLRAPPAAQPYRNAHPFVPALRRCRTSSGT
jgi:hypothetical protein